MISEESMYQSSMTNSWSDNDDEPDELPTRVVDGEDDKIGDEIQRSIKLRTLTFD
jgi:hypothetical protein